MIAPFNRVSRFSVGPDCLALCPLTSISDHDSSECEQQATNLLRDSVVDNRRFLHTTWLGGKIVRGFWDMLQRGSVRHLSHYHCNCDQQYPIVLKSLDSKRITIT